MTRQAFMDRLRIALRGLPAQAANEILADYEAHFAEGAAAGRAEGEIAANLGDPDRLAKELRTESALRRWEDRRSPAGALGAVFALVGLGTLDMLVMAPVLLTIASLLFGLSIGTIGMFLSGAAAFLVGPFTGMAGGLPAALLLGLGLMSGSIAAGSVLAILGVYFVNGVVWYARLHYRVLKPAFETPVMREAL